MEPRYTTGEVAEMLGMTRRTLHFYEEIVLVTPFSKSNGGQRLYTAEQVRQLRFITALKDLGVPLAKIKDMLDVRNRNEGRPKPAAEETIAVINELLPKIGDQLRVLSQLQNDLLVSREILRTCGNCGRSASKAECRQCEVVCQRESLPQTIQEIWLA